MQYEHYLKSMFEPQSVAIIGASERPDSIGAVIVAIAIAVLNVSLYNVKSATGLLSESAVRCALEL